MLKPAMDLILRNQDWLAFVVQADASHWGLVVVGEEYEPVFGDGAAVEALALGDAGYGVEVVSHDPGGIEMPAGGDEVGDVAGAFGGAAW